MRNFIIKALCVLIPFPEKRRKLRDDLLRKYGNKRKILTQKSHYYGKIYLPYYPDCKFDDSAPEIFNKDGQKMETYFIRDEAGAHCPYLESSKYFLWDRFNIGLKTHFYTHKTILETMGEPDKKYAMFAESESIIPKEYQIFETHKGIEKDFDGIFTYSENLLNTLDNAKFFPCASIWYAKEIFQGEKDPVQMNDKVYELKNKNISMVCSDKLYTKMHVIRHSFAKAALESGNVDVYGGYNNNPLKFKSTSLENYRFQIVVENDIASYYFTEKVMDCFASMTIPVYLGATKIDEFFNPDGIIKINKDTDIKDILKICTEAEYLKRLDAVKENYQKTLKYTNINDLMFEMYLSKNPNPKLCF